MQTVSDKWKAIHNQQLVNESFVEVSFNIADPDAISDTSASDNGSIYYSNTAQIVSEVDKTSKKYATLEENMWLLDNSMRFIDDNCGDTGYIGNELSLQDCTFTNNPIITINFSQVHTPIIPGITISWGEVYGEYAEEFRVKAYNGNTVVANELIEDNQNTTSIVLMDISNYNRITVEVIKWCLPYHRARIIDLFVGIKKIYNKKSITQYSHEMIISPIGQTVPMNKMVFSIDNTNNVYDPNNETGLSKYLIQRQTMKVKYGLKIDDDTIEYIKGGTFYLSEWDSPQNGINANFTARDLLEFMNKTYTKGLYSPNGTSLYDLAMDVLTEAHLPLNNDGSVKYQVSTSLQNIYTTAPLPICTLSECLQYIAQAGCCVIYCDRNDVLHIESDSNQNSDYNLTPFNMYSRPEVSLQKPLMGISTKIYSYSIEDANRELFNGSVNINGTKTIVIAYSNIATSVSASVTDGTLDNAVYYTNTCHLTITASGNVSIVVTGTTLKQSDSTITLNVGDDGENQPIDNPLITSSSVANDVTSWVNNWLSNRKTLKMGNWRSDPRLDPLDVISSENKFSTDVVKITSVKYTYTGCFKATGEGRITNVD